MSLRKTRPYFTKFTYDLSTETLNPAQSLTYDFLSRDCSAAKLYSAAKLSCGVWLDGCVSHVRALRRNG